MLVRRVPLSLAVVCLCLSCGDEPGATSETMTSVDSLTSLTDSDSQTSGPSDTSGPGDAGDSSSGPDDSSDSTSGPSDTSDDGTTGTKFDLGAIGDLGNSGPCDCGAQSDLSLIWVANTNESTISKIDTEAMVELGRYRVHPSSGTPSRTSVSIDGRAVAVANRTGGGGVTKVWANANDCDPNKNGQGGLQTSSGANDVLAWDGDDCVAWHHPFNTYTTNRPIAWTSGDQNQATCEYEDQGVWTAGCQTGVHAFMQVHLLDGDDGSEVAFVEHTSMPCFTFGAYGGAVDSYGNFWFTSNAGDNRLAVVYADDLSVDSWPAPTWGYGMTVDSTDMVWFTGNTANSASPISAMRFDPETETWDTVDNIKLKGYAGITEGEDGLMWMNYLRKNDQNEHGIAWIDTATMEVAGTFPVPGVTNRLNGISLDAAGRVWAIAPGDNTAFRYNPGNQQLDSIGGLNNPYTYSDMTGRSLQNSACGSPTG